MDSNVLHLDSNINNKFECHLLLTIPVLIQNVYCYNAIIALTTDKHP